MRQLISMSCLVAALASLAPLALAQSSNRDRFTAPLTPGRENLRHHFAPAPQAGAARQQGELQLDVTTLLEQWTPQPAPMARTNGPMFSDGWTRDGFGGQRGGWR
jgi:hypothetical protein